MPDRIIRLNELIDLLGGVSRQTIWEWEKEGKIPPRFKLTKNGRAVGWLSSTIEEWLQERQQSAGSEILAGESSK